MAIPYSQRDVEWGEDRLGTSKEYTMSTAGCLVTAVASMLSDLTDRPVSPGELNLWLRENKGFASGALFIFNSVAPFGVRLAEMIHCQSTPAPIKHMSEALEDGAVVIVQVDSKPGGALDQHWVRLLTVDEKDAEIIDPGSTRGKRRRSSRATLLRAGRPRRPSSPWRSTNAPAATSWTFGRSPSTWTSIRPNSTSGPRRRSRRSPAWRSASNLRNPVRDARIAPVDRE